MKRCFFGKILGFLTVILLLANTIIPNFYSLEHNIKTFVNSKEIKKTDLKSFQFSSEISEENIEDDVENEFSKDFLFHFQSYSEIANSLILFSQNQNSKKYSSNQINEQTVPKWLLVRHILI